MPRSRDRAFTRMRQLLGTLRQIVSLSSPARSAISGWNSAGFRGGTRGSGTTPPLAISLQCLGANKGCLQNAVGHMCALWWADLKKRTRPDASAAVPPTVFSHYEHVLSNAWNASAGHVQSRPARTDQNIQRRYRATRCGVANQSLHHLRCDLPDHWGHTRDSGAPSWRRRIASRATLTCTAARPSLRLRPAARRCAPKGSNDSGRGPDTDRAALFLSLGGTHFTKVSPPGGAGPRGNVVAWRSAEIPHLPPPPVVVLAALLGVPPVGLRRGHSCRRRRLDGARPSSAQGA
eukprot:gene9812-biopygen12259